MLSSISSVNSPINVPSPQETAGSVGFKGKPSGKELKKLGKMLDKLEFDMLMKNPNISTAEKQEHIIRRFGSVGVWEQLKLFVQNVLKKVSP